MIAQRWLRPLKIAVVIYLAYLALLMLVALPLLNVFAPKIYRAQTGRELQLGKIILLNPFTLTLTVRDAASNNADGSRFWSVETLRVDVALSSLWQRALVLDEVRVTGLDVQIEQLSAERYNFSDILDFRAAQALAQEQAQKSATNEPETSSGKLFPIRIDHFIFNINHFGVRAPHSSEPIALQINDVNLALDHFATLATADETAAQKNAVKTLPILHSGAFAFSIGVADVQFLRSQQPFATQLRAVQIKLDHFSSREEQPQAYALSAKIDDGGELASTGSFSLAAQENRGEVHLHNINLLPIAHFLSGKLAFDTQRALLDIDAPYQLHWGEHFFYRVDKGRAALREVRLQSRRDADTSAGLAALQLDGIDVDSAAPRAHIASVTLDEFALRGWNKDTHVSVIDMLQFPASDDSDSAPWQIQIDDIRARNGHIRWRASQLDAPELAIAPLELHATNLHWPDAAPLQLNISTAINSATKIAVAGTVDPVNLTGNLSGDVGNLPLSWGNTLLGQQISANLKSGLLGSHFQVAFDRGHATNLQSEGSVSDFELRQLPDGRKLVAWQQLQWHQLTLDLRAQRLQLDQIALSAPWVQFRINADGTNNFQQLLISQPAAAKSESKPWQLAIRNIHTDAGTLDFRDNSLSRPFHARIDNFNGNLDGLTNQNQQAAKVNFKGSVDSYAPVALTGTANPFAAQPSLNIALDIANLDLAALTPYSGTYAGYTINSGLLSVQLAYTLENNRIKGSNHIVVTKMELGEQVSGPKVKDLPLRLAMYLLTDANGVMDLGVDVSGNVDDPNFDIGSIIWQAFRNLIFKTVSSPFRALASVLGIGVERDLGVIDFSAGSAQLDDESRSKLVSLTEALTKKPALHLRITGHTNPWQDKEALSDNQLSEQLMQVGVSAADIQQQSKRWQQKVGELFRKRFPDEKADSLVAMEMNDALRDNIGLGPNALAELAGQRAQAVKSLLVGDLGVAADRIFIDAASASAEKTPAPQVTLQIE